ncbi:MAG: tetratricopeptide repeat protein [Candidatus Sumerlaeaceae bacterium]|jgi:tetratricopeptide (TPR) repeat protein
MSKQNVMSGPPQSVAAKELKDLLPLEVLIAIFIVVEALIIWLMAPQFTREFTRWKSQRYAMKGDYKAAAQELYKLLQTPKGENNPTFLAELGNCYYNLGDYDKSIEFYQRAQENRMNVVADLDDDSPHEYPDFNAMIGLCYFRKGDLDKAEEYFKKALEANRLDKLAHMKLGEIEFKKGKYLKAIDYFKFVARDPAYEKAVREYYQKIEAELFKGVAAPDSEALTTQSK